MFGCLSYTRVKNVKLEPRAWKCIFVGYSSGGKGHRLWCIAEGKYPKFVIIRDMTFKSDMCNQRGGGTNVAGTHHAAIQKVKFKIETPNSFVINVE